MRKIPFKLKCLSFISWNVNFSTLHLWNLNHLNSSKTFSVFCPVKNSHFPIAVPPIVTLRLGSTLVVDDIKESDDIYFECDIKANPPWRKLSWLHDVSDDMRSGRHLWWITAITFLKSMINNEIKAASFMTLRGCSVGLKFISPFHSSIHSNFLIHCSNMKNKLQGSV